MKKILLILIFILIKGDIYIKNNGKDNIECGKEETPCKTIRYSILQAKKEDKIIFFEGKYEGEGNNDIRMNGKNISFQSKTGNREKTIINCNQKKGFKFINEESTISDLTFMSCHNISDSLEKLKPNENFDFKTIKPNEYQNGGAINSLNSKITIKNVKFIKNRSDLLGGAISTIGGSISIENSEFIENQSFSGASIFTDNTETKMIKTIFRENHARQSSSSFELVSGLIDIKEIKVYNNTGAFNGAAFGLYNTKLGSVIKDVEVYENKGLQCLIKINGGVLEINNMRYVKNEGKILSGFCIDQTNLKIKNSIIQNNTGRSFWVRSSNLTISSTSILDNHGGMMTSFEDSYTTINHCLIKNNNQKLIDGSVYSQSGGTSVFKNTTFDSNYGSNILFVNGLKLKITNSKIMNGKGGGLLCQFSKKFINENNLFQNNIDYNLRCFECGNCNNF
jgi:hypothetical protein